MSEDIVVELSPEVKDFFENYHDGGFQDNFNRLLLETLIYKGIQYPDIQRYQELIRQIQASSYPENESGLVIAPHHISVLYLFYMNTGTRFHSHTIEEKIHIFLIDTLERLKNSRINELIKADKLQLIVDKFRDDPKIQYYNQLIARISDQKNLLVKQINKFDSKQYYLNQYQYIMNRLHNLYDGSKYSDIIVPDINLGTNFSVTFQNLPEIDHNYHRI